MQELLPTESIEAELNQALNATTFETDAKLTNANIAKRNKLRIDLNNNKFTQEQVIKSKNEYLTSCNLGIPNLIIDEEGQLTYLDRFIRKPFFSAGELIRIVASLVSKTQVNKPDNDSLKYFFIEEFNLLDEENQKKVIDYLTKLNFQLVIEYVGTEDDVDPNNYIILTENLNQNGSN